MMSNFKIYFCHSDNRTNPFVEMFEATKIYGIDVLENFKEKLVGKRFQLGFRGQQIITHYDKSNRYGRLQLDRIPVYQSTIVLSFLFQFL